jgi:hypothetical protein
LAKVTPDDQDRLRRKDESMEIAGTQLRHASQALTSNEPSDRVKLAMQVVVSALLLVAGLIIILTVHSQDTQKLASGWIGAVLGYWLK